MKLISLIILIFLFPILSYSHGIHYEILKDNIIGIEVKYEDGVPLGEQPVRVFSPDNKSKAYIKSKTNHLGRYYFKADKKGDWIVIVQDAAGHAVRVNVRVEKDEVKVKNQSNAIDPFQKIIMSLSIIWGLIGTALFFYRNKKN